MCVFNPKEAEEMTIREALSWIKRHGFTHVQIEPDALQIIQSLKQNCDDSSCDLVLLDIKDLLRSIPCVVNSNKIHSILYFGEDVPYATSNETLVLSGLNMLRVLDLSLIKFQYALPGEVENLVHLRYLALSAGCGSLGNFKMIKLRNLQTLIICSQKKDCRHLQLPPDILELPWLQHVRVDKRSSLYLPGLAKNNLQTLIWLNVIGKDPKTTDFKQVPKLKELWVFIDNELPPDAFKSLVDLKLLEKLKIEGESVNSFNFPTALPENLKKLTIRRTYLPWKDMDIIGRLKNLEVLKLKKFAFDGPEWNLSDAVFPRLKLFVISDLNLECWNADAEHFPKLECLILKCCIDLNELPIDFASITTLRLIELHNCYSSLVESAKEIQEEKMRFDSTLVIHDHETKVQEEFKIAEVLQCQTKPSIDLSFVCFSSAVLECSDSPEVLQCQTKPSIDLSFVCFSSAVLECSDSPDVITPTVIALNRPNKTDSSDAEKLIIVHSLILFATKDILATTQAGDSSPTRRSGKYTVCLVIGFLMRSLSVRG
nr:putative late blight resistance protein homolog R1B-14 [Ipomoea batatas]